MSENLFDTPRTDPTGRQTSSNPEELWEFEPLSDHGGRWVYLIGMWLLFGLVSAVAGLFGDDQFASAPTGPELVAFVFIALFAAAVLFWVTRRFWRLCDEARRAGGGADVR